MGSPRVGSAITPSALVTVVLAFVGQREAVTPAWLLNYRQSIAALMVLVLCQWFFGTIVWYFRLRGLVETAAST